MMVVALDQTFKNASSITGNKDMTLYEIIEIIITQTKMNLIFKHDKASY